MSEYVQSAATSARTRNTPAIIISDNSDFINVSVSGLTIRATRRTGRHDGNPDAHAGLLQRMVSEPTSPGEEQ